MFDIIVNTGMNHRGKRKCRNLHERTAADGLENVCYYQQYKQGFVIRHVNNDIPNREHDVFYLLHHCQYSIA